MRLPGFSFKAMSLLTYDWNWALYHVFTDELLLAIFWEESIFNNIAQSGGTAVGLGQIEPSELPKLRKYGIYTDRQAVLNSPGHAIECTAYLLKHLHESQTGAPSKLVTLKRYAGYYYDYAAWRLTLINGWLECERQLLAIGTPEWSKPDAVMTALSKARGFPTSDSRYRQALFP